MKMSTANSSKSEISKLLLSRKSLLDQITMARYNRSKLLAELNLVKQKGLPETNSTYQKALSSFNIADSNLNNLQGNLDKVQGQSNNHVKNFVRDGPSSAIQTIPADTPILMFPVRMETRYVTGDNGTELWIRVYPDEIEHDTFEGALTDDEISQDPNVSAPSSSNPPPNLTLDEWQKLAIRFGPRRASWILNRADPSLVKNSSWEMAPMTNVMPDQWVVVGWSRGAVSFTVSGNPISSQLHVGLDPNSVIPPGEQVDSNLKWIIDFGTAYNQGMALKVPAANIPSGGIDRLIVFGVKASVDPEISANILSELFDHHHYTDGIGFVPKGAPAHNSGTIRSSYTSYDPGYQKSYSVEVNGVLGTMHNNPSHMTDAELLAYALGFDPSIFSHVENADLCQAQNSRNMMTALWPGTLGYYMQQMILGPEDPNIENLRKYVVNYLYPGGLLPTIRIGQTPYGFLPVMSIDESANSLPLFTVGNSSPLQMPLQQLYNVWLGYANNAPTIGTTNDPDAEIVSVFGMDSNSGSFSVRYGYSNQYLENLLDFLGVSSSNVSTWLSNTVGMSSPLPNAIGLGNLNLPIIGTVFDDKSYSLHIPIVQDEAISDQPLPDNQNYIKWLSNSTIDNIKSGKTGLNPGYYSLLYKVLRTSVLRGYEDGAFKILLNQNLVKLSDKVEPIMINMDQINQTQTIWTRFNMSVSISGASVRVADYVQNSANYSNPLLLPVADMNSAVVALSPLKTGELTYLFTGVLDSFSHRIDTWITSIANKRLLDIRSSQNNSICIGAYSWIENLPPPQSVASLTVGNSGLTPEKVGYMHGPTMSHAKAAALLRNAYVSGADMNNNYTTPMDLSSERVRRALLLLEGIRQGSSLNAILGSWFERDLIDSNPTLAGYVQNFRDLYPIAPTNPVNVQTPTKSVTPRDVVDGYALEQAWLNNSIPFGTNNLPNQGTNNYNGIVTALKDIVDVMDAVNDLSIAESAYQVVRGNFSAAAGIMNSISEGKRPPEPEVVRSPHSSTQLTNRFVLALPSGATMSTNWPDPTATNNSRGLAEPNLNSWVGFALGDPAQVGCTVTVTNVDSSIDNKPQAVTLEDLQLGPLDVLYLGTSDGTPRAGELEQRISYKILAPFANKISNKSTLTISFDNLPASTGITFPQILELAYSIRQMIDASSPLGPSDLVTLDKSNPSGDTFDVSDLQNRENAVESLFTTNLSNISNLLNSIGVDPEDSLQDRQNELSILKGNLSTPSIKNAIAKIPALLISASMLASKSSIPVDSNGMPQQDLLQLVIQALAVFDDLYKRSNNVITTHSQLTSQGKKPDGPTCINWIQKLLGEDFKVLPLFSTTDLTDLKNSLSSSGLVPDPNAPFLWFQQASHVQDHLSKYSIVATYADILSTGLKLDLRVAQIPFSASDTWYALPQPGSIKKNRVSIVFAQPSNDFASGNEISGLVIDDWQEHIPNSAETSGVSYYYQDPNSQAPHTLLLALAPGQEAVQMEARVVGSQDTNYWSLDYLISVLNDSFDLARIRCVDPDQVGVRNQFIPSLIFSDNLQNHTVATKFRGHDL